MPIYRNKYPVTLRKKTGGETLHMSIRPSNRVIVDRARVIRKGNLRVLHESNWKINHTPLVEMNERYGGITIQHALHLARTQFAHETINVVEWGCGAADALTELARNHQGKEMRFIGLSGDQYQQWALRKKLVEFYNDDASHFHRYFRFGKKIHFMFSQNGLVRLSDAELHNQLKELGPKFARGGILLMESGFDSIICPLGFKVIDHTKRATVYQRI